MSTHLRNKIDICVAFIIQTGYNITIRKVVKHLNNDIPTNDIISKIKARRSELNYSFQDLADRTGLSKSTLQRYESGKIGAIPLSKLKILSKALEVTPEYLLGLENNNKDEYNLCKCKNIYPIELKKFPLLGEIACGEPVFCVENRESYVLAGADIKADFCLKAKGDSMINARILDGDIVFIRKQQSVENGEIAAVIIDDEATLKRVYYDKSNNYLQLIAENPKYSPMVYTNEQLETIRILGKAIAFQSDVK